MHAMYVCIYVCMYIICSLCMYACYVCMNACIYVCMYVLYVCMFNVYYMYIVCMYVCLLYVCILYVCIYVCMYVYIMFIVGMYVYFLCMCVCARGSACVCLCITPMSLFSGSTVNKISSCLVSLKWRQGFDLHTINSIVVFSYCLERNGIYSRSNYVGNICRCAPIVANTAAMFVFNQRWHF